MKKELLLGDEAIALSAINAGLSGVYAYPGTPSTEITEFIQLNKLAAERGIHRTWSTNEKTAMEAALGMSFMGKRALVCMKHVGMNVAADPFVNSAMSGTNGGLIVVAADDPSMHSSQNEQDSRHYGRFAFIPMMEPSSQQEAYDMTSYGYELSEKYRMPVLMRVTTRLAHSRAVVEVGETREQNSCCPPENSKQWILLPANSRARYVELLALQNELEEESETAGFNQYIDGEDKSIGIIACGIGYNYLMENCPEGCKYPVVKISQYPLPKKMIAKLVSQCDEIMVIEEGQPMVEEQLKGLLGMGVTVRGRLDGTLPRTGELSPDCVRAALDLPENPRAGKCEIVVPRPPALCQGCGHRDMYTTLNEVLNNEYPNHKVFADIGCYTLGAMPPFRSIDTCVEMGASITMAKGASDAGQFPAVAVIGDSTFTPSGMTGLLDCVNDKANVTIIISDNLTTGMTGGQDSAGTGKLEAICRGLGVEEEHIRVMTPLPKNYEEMKQIIREEIEYKGVSVLIPRRECIQTLKRHLKNKKK